MRYLFCAILLFFAYGLSASAPLEGGFPLAPRSSASQEEKDRAYADARNRVINAAKKYENVPYLYGGVTSVGLDCSGFIYISFKDALGVSLPRSASGLYSWAEKIPFDKAQPGDLLFFKTGSSDRITHVALYLGNRMFIHSASSGAKTGVIYTTLDEGSWSRTFAGAGRAIPETVSGHQSVPASVNTPVNTGTWGGGQTVSPPQTSPSSKDENSTRFLYGFAFAPTWNGFLKDGALVRGFTSQFRIAADTSIFNTNMLFGLELRPEYDGALGVFRLPLTLSWGFNDKYRIFAGPVLSMGSASISTDEGERHYSGGTSWLGTIGVTAAPFTLNTKRGAFAPYVEAAWQSYFSDNSNSNLNADFSAGFRFSTGLRWTIRWR